MLALDAFAIPISSVHTALTLRILLPLEALGLAVEYLARFDGHSSLYIHGILFQYDGTLAFPQVKAVVNPKDVI